MNSKVGNAEDFYPDFDGKVLKSLFEAMN